MLKRYIMIVVIYLLCFISPFIPGFMWLAGRFPTIQQGYGTVYTGVFLITLAVVLLLLLPERHMRSDKKASPLISVVWAVLGVFALYLIQVLSVLINYAAFGQIPKSEHTQDIISLARMSPIFILTVSIVGPLLEEIVFRKIFYGSLRRKTGVILAAIISSLVFALMHGDIRNLIIYFNIGLFLCFTYQMTNRIVVNMFMHAAMNAAVVLISLNAPAISGLALSFFR